MGVWSNRDACSQSNSFDAAQQRATPTRPLAQKVHTSVVGMRHNSSFSASSDNKQASQTQKANIDQKPDSSKRREQKPKKAPDE